MAHGLCRICDDGMGLLAVQLYVMGVRIFNCITDKTYTRISLSASLIFTRKITRTPTTRIQVDSSEIVSTKEESGSIRSNVVISSQVTLSSIDRTSFFSANGSTRVLVCFSHGRRKERYVRRFSLSLFISLSCAWIHISNFTQSNRAGEPASSRINSRDTTLCRKR